MRPKHRAAAIALLAALCLSGSPAGGAASAAPAGTDTAPERVRQVTLPTGDTVGVSAGRDGRTRLAVDASEAAEHLRFTLRGHQHLVPRAALPWLGEMLDPSLFDLEARSRDAKAGQAIALTYRPGVGTPAPPGIRLTSRSATRATGVVESPKEFGAALRANSPDRPGMFGDVTRIAAAGAAEPPARPRAATHTLTVNGIDAAGAPATNGEALVFNIDDVKRFEDFANFDDGTDTLEVPAGRYAMIGIFFNDEDQETRVTVQTFTAHADRTITADARKASSRVSVTPPRRASLDLQDMTVHVDDANGVGSGLGLTAQLTAMYVQPVTRHTAGLEYSVYAHLASPDASRDRYTYDLAFARKGTIPADQSFTPRPDDLAAVPTTYRSQRAGEAGATEAGYLMPWDAGPFITLYLYDVTMPSRQTQYYTADPRMQWLTGVQHGTEFESLAPYFSAWTVMRPGRATRAVWGGQPGGPRLFQGVSDPFTDLVFCPACADGTTLDLSVMPFGDSDPAHYGRPSFVLDSELTESTAYRVFADGKQVAAGDQPLATRVTVPAGTKTYRIDHDTVRTSPQFHLSTDIRTSWTLPAAATTGVLPKSWTCRPEQSRDCRVLRLLTHDYDLPVDDLGRTAPGKAKATLSLGHLGRQADPAMKSVTLELSYDGGKTWQDVDVRKRGKSRYQATYTVPNKGATDGYGSLRLTAKDTAGGTLTQTITHAYAITS